MEVAQVVQEAMAVAVVAGAMAVAVAVAAQLVVAAAAAVSSEAAAWSLMEGGRLRKRKGPRVQGYGLRVFNQPCSSTTDTHG